MMKNKAVIQNQERKHLWLDSNTICYHRGIWSCTFAAENQTNAFNACLYGKNNYISVHNKIFYITPSDKTVNNETFPQVLMKGQSTYIKRQKGDYFDRLHLSNRLYSRVFVVSVSMFGLAYIWDWNRKGTQNRYGANGKRIAKDGIERPLPIYAAYFWPETHQPSFRLTSYVTCRINGSWLQKSKPQ